ncbi:MAG: ADP-ribosylglycohydrolase family protein [Deltaproteobacteria bacterium]|nr:ADP-ribosylglycohydrolase family protein [Deltaproteobacteria bacterium]
MSRSTKRKPTALERVEGGLIGLLVGDALGVPYEFHPASEIPAAGLIEYQPPEGFSRAHVGVPPGTWSDDGAQALCLLASLLHRGGLDVEDFGRRLQNWYELGYLAVDNDVFDVGVTTGRAIAALRAGTPALEAGPSDTYSNGNGSLMRSLPLALWHTGPDARLVEDAFAQSRVTHGHLRAQVCCGLYCLWARCWLEDAGDPWGDATARFRALFPLESREREELEWQVRPDEAPSGNGSGYVVDSLRSARLAMELDSYEGVVRQAIRLGNDTDTTACVAGGIAGLRGGVQEIPERWRAKLRGEALYRPLLDGLLAHLTVG